MGQRFERKHLIRLCRFMDMMYRPSEVASIVGVTVQTVYRSYLPDGCPFEQDKNGDFWVHGLSFKGWVELEHKKRKQGKLADGEAWCLICHKAVAQAAPQERYRNQYVVIYQGRCPECKSKINRAYSAKTEKAEEK